MLWWALTKGYGSGTLRKHSRSIVPITAERSIPDFWLAPICTIKTYNIQINAPSRKYHRLSQSGVNCCVHAYVYRHPSSKSLISSFSMFYVIEVQGSSIAAADRKVFWSRPAARATAYLRATARWMRRGHPRRPSLRSLVVPPTRGTSSGLVVMEMKAPQRCRGSLRTAHRCLILMIFNGRTWFWWYQQLDDKHMAHENLKPSRIDQHLKRYLTLFDTIWH